MTTQPTDLDQDEYLRQRPRSVAETMGEDVIDPAPLDQPGIPKSAKQHAKRVTDGRAGAAHRQNMAQLHVAAGRDRDEQANEEVMRRISKGQDISPALAEAAMRHERRQGGLGLSTADQLAAATLARLRREAPPDDDDKRRQAGRRPRS